MDIRVQRLDRESVSDFYSLHSQPPFRWCFCAAWSVPTWDGWGKRTAEQNRMVREAIFAQGRYDGYLLYVGGVAVGWCQCAPRDRFPKLVQQYRLDPDPEAYAISCLCIAPSHMKQGLCHTFVQEILKDLEACGVRVVEAFPKIGLHTDDEVWTGPESVFRKAGFEVVREMGKVLYMRRNLGPLKP